MRVFTFTDDPTGRLDFRHCYEAFRVRDPSKITKDERPHLAEIQKELERVSVPIGDAPDDGIPDMRFRKLAEGGGTIRIKVKTYEKFESLIDEAPFQAGQALPVVALQDRMTAAPKEDSAVAPKDVVPAAQDEAA